MIIISRKRAQKTRRRGEEEKNYTHLDEGILKTSTLMKVPDCILSFWRLVVKCMAVDYTNNTDGLYKMKVKKK